MKIFIATPMYGGIAKNNYVISLQNLVVELSNAGHSVATTTVGNESLITRARNTLAHKFLKTDFDALLFIDSDHGFNAKDVLKMVESGKDLIGAIYPMKGINWENVRLAALAGKENLEGYSGYFAVNLLDQSQEINAEESFKVKDIGTGMMFITRKVFEDLKPICRTYKHNSVGDLGIQFGELITEYFKTDIENDILLSEDYAFCRMWQSLGNDVYAAPWVRITHSGDYNFAGQFAGLIDIALFKEELKAKMSNSNQPAESDSTEEEEKEPSSE